MVTYWLAKLLDPHHEVVLSHEHQDFKVVGLFVKFIASSFGLENNQFTNQQGSLKVPKIEFFIKLIFEV